MELSSPLFRGRFSLKKSYGYRHPHYQEIWKQIAYFFPVSELWGQSLGHHGDGGEGEQLPHSSCEHSPPHHCFPQSTSPAERASWVSGSNLYTHQGTPTFVGPCIVWKMDPLLPPYALRKAASHLYFPFSTVRLCCMCSNFPCGTWTSTGTARGSDTWYLWHSSLTRSLKLQKWSRA